MKRRELIIGGVRTAIAEGGPQDASDAVVFVHGNPGPSDDWDDLGPRVGAFARVLTMDMPGYGRSERPVDFDFTVDGYGRHLGALLDELGIDGAHLVLHDFGGGWGLRWAIDHPERLRSLTLINTGVLLDYEWHGFAKLWQLPVLGELSYFLLRPSITRRMVQRTNPVPLPDEFFDRVASYSDFAHHRAVLALYRASAKLGEQQNALASDLSNLDPPTLVLWGEGDAFVPVRFAERQKEIFPRAVVHTLPGCGHWPFVDQPEVVAGHLLAFLREQVGVDGEPPLVREP